jgi:hypothetical protein
MTTRTSAKAGGGRAKRPPPRGAGLNDGVFSPTPMSRAFQFHLHPPFNLDFRLTHDDTQATSDSPAALASTDPALVRPSVCGL